MPSFTSDLLETPALEPAQEDIIMWSAHALYSGGTDTVGSPFHVFCYADTQLSYIVGSCRRILFPSDDCEWLPLPVLGYESLLSAQMFPEVQRKAKEEIDAVVGHDRLPRVADQTSLPYLTAVGKEVLRWHPVAPIGKFLCLA
jgi:hypothetical protein